MSEPTSQPELLLQEHLPSVLNAAENITSETGLTFTVNAPSQITAFKSGVVVAISTFMQTNETMGHNHIVLLNAIKGTGVTAIESEFAMEVNSLQSVIRLIIEEFAGYTVPSYQRLN